MINKKSILAIIPARSGSKRIHNKNTIDFCGKPLMSWTISAANNSRYIDKTIVSTDCSDIASIAEKYSAEIPFLRPSSLSTDTSTTIEVIQHTIETLKTNNSLTFDYIILLQPTSPLREAKHIDEAIEMMIEKNADCIVSVSETSHPIEWTNELPQSLSLEGFISEKAKQTRSQDFPKRYQLNGAIYILKRSEIDNHNNLIWEKNSYAFIMPPEASIDIDNTFDLKFAEYIKLNQNPSS